MSTNTTARLTAESATPNGRHAEARALEKAPADCGGRLTKRHDVREHGERSIKSDAVLGVDALAETFDLNDTFTLLLNEDGRFRSELIVLLDIRVRRDRCAVGRGRHRGDQGPTRELREEIG